MSEDKDDDDEATQPIQEEEEPISWQDRLDEEMREAYEWPSVYDPAKDGMYDFVDGFEEIIGLVQRSEGSIPVIGGDTQ